MELLRVHLFDIVTQYRSIFSDHDTDHGLPHHMVTTGAAGVDTDMFDNRLLFTSWLTRKVHQFLKIVAEDLNSGITSFESIMGQVGNLPKHRH